MNIFLGEDLRKKKENSSRKLYKQNKKYSQGYNVQHGEDSQ